MSDAIERLARSLGDYQFLGGFDGLSSHLQGELRAEAAVHLRALRETTGDIEDGFIRDSYGE